jgi:tRNA-Thr(GGU) m(6)t(6)A37 methyltransferase TsaA
MEISFKPIGYIYTPFREVKGMPIQPTGAVGVTGRIEVEPEFKSGIKDLEGFSYIFLLYHLHLVKEFKLLVKPFLDTQKRGIFATRSPVRPNAIGLSVLKLTRIEETTLWVENVDILNGTPILDIKPYVPEFDTWPADRIGWFSHKADAAKSYRADERFTSCYEPEKYARKDESRENDASMPPDAEQVAD